MFTPRKTVRQMTDEARARIENLSAEQVKAETERGDVQLIDIRDYRERQRDGWIPGSISMPRGMLEFWMDPTSNYYRGRVDPEKRIVLF